MLVLSRKEDQRVFFPGLGISIQVIRVKGSLVHLGFDAPMEVRIIREELANGDAQRDRPTSGALRERVIQLPKHLRHEIRNELNSLSIALHLFKQEVEDGDCKGAEETFEKLV
ncbi:MAG: carbon storage regulator, partial [Pirellulales bacterium]|nr:carbon storage regulator [Pirellulales bacterium]